jgi:hypothetical protein
VYAMPLCVFPPCLISMLGVGPISVFIQALE